MQSDHSITPRPHPVMLWSDLCRAVPAVAQGGQGDPSVSDIVYDSRLVGPGAVFVAVSGLRDDGTKYIRMALDQGAVAVVSASPLPWLQIPWIAVEDPRSALGFLARTLWADDDRDRLSIGITGTNGKTTCAYLYHSLMGVVHGLPRSWMFGTVVYRVNGVEQDATHTTPEAARILRMIGTSAQRPAALTMEVSSHSLALQRVAGLRFDLALWTNLTQDHLDFHGTMENYYLAKKLLFTDYLKPQGLAVINIDDPWGERLVTEIAGRRMVTFGRSEQADCRVVNSACDWNGTSVTVRWQDRSYPFRSTLRGTFNVSNMCALCAGALGTGTDPALIQQAFDALPAVPGRMERVAVDPGYAVVVDYAHTPDALEKVLMAARPLTRGRLICVFGCGGDRDRTKRPRMAQAVAYTADEAVVTSDNPRSEKPQAIIDEILTGMPLDFPHVDIVDRREAIAWALAHAGTDDCVVIAGKGHESYQEINGVRHHFDDREVVAEIITSPAAGADHGA